MDASENPPSHMLDPALPKQAGTPARTHAEPARVPMRHLPAGMKGVNLAVLRRFVHVIVIASFHVSATLALPSYRLRIPNGGAVPCPPGVVRRCKLNISLTPSVESACVATP